ncbi:MAG TPA: acetoacetate decarboxylase family protein, partial [Ktedonobacterales bacterium]|nr:acetoacetate decarboxylase family protein [Ktedonobacterales bacterium]
VIMGHLRRRDARALAQHTQNPRGLMAAPLVGSLASLALVRYNATPVGPYHELAISPGVLWHAIPAAFISDMLVDSVPSWLGGRSLWGLPKALADFTWTANSQTQTVAVAAGSSGELLLRAEFRLRGSLPGIIVPPIPVISVRGPRHQLFNISGRVGRIHRATVTLDIPATSTFSALGQLVRGPHLALWLDGFHLRISTALDLL